MHDSTVKYTQIRRIPSELFLIARLIGKAPSLIYTHQISLYAYEVSRAFIIKLSPPPPRELRIRRINLNIAILHNIEEVFPNSIPSIPAVFPYCVSVYALSAHIFRPSS